VPVSNDAYQDNSWSGGGTALVVLDAAPSKHAGTATLTSAPLIAQLIATRLDMPQTRARRRIAGSEGFSAYGAASDIIRAGHREPGLSWVA
jgi:hypothetical protein